MSNSRNRAKAQLILLVGDFMAARRSDDAAAKHSTTQALQSFATGTAFPNLMTKANATLAVASIEDMNEGLARMGEIADQLSPLRQTFQTGAEIAEEGEASLFFPRVASTLVQTEEMLNVLISSVEDFKEGIEAELDDFDITKAMNLVDKLKSAGDELKAKLDSLQA